ncbi:uncharacterized protein LY79DRAFT_414432 [Colletotrichum navitas]|uniref:Alpha/beta hydrolase fold-3 domain-containing protein n=1 Tax=Colletotrichum navitas TaxID=681940 RepID=A0AAD8PP46_9PEZI|nr:uncharacterized protein LY79DRAFT_414432 [Colletotrichum navitas]KAK1573321.1 hypothetical protein LY79DRAFT_414432 [Colletotrichum navitas]
MSKVDLTRFLLKPLRQGWLEAFGIVLLYVQHRLATEEPFTAPVEDFFPVLKQATKETIASELGLHKRRIDLIGVSADATLALTATFGAGDEGLVPSAWRLIIVIL